MDPLDLVRVLDNVGDAVLSVGVDGELGLVNEAARSLLGIRRGDEGSAFAWFSALGALHADGKTPVSEGDFPLVAAARLGEPATLDVFLSNPRAPGGSLLRVSAWPVRAPDGAGTGAVAVVRPVESAQATQSELHGFFSAVIDHVGDPIFVKDRQHRWVVLNRAFNEMVQFSRAEMIGKTDHDFFPKEQADFFHAKDREMFASESTVSIEEEPITDASGREHWLATTKMPLRDATGEVTHLVGIIHDITRLKTVEADLRQRNLQLAAQVREHNAVEAQLQVAIRDLEGFCHSVSHDLRTPLRAIDGFSALLLEEHAAQLDEAGRKCLERVRTNAQRMAQLMDDLLHLSRVARSPVHREPVDLRELAEQVVEELRRSEPHRRVTVSLVAPLTAEADPQLVLLLLENLLGNAWKFTRLRAEAHIILRRSGHTFCVEDDGAGFDMAYVGALFKPFSRLHGNEQFPGTGVGLATVHRIVERHGGRVWAEGEVDKGAKIWFTLEGEAATRTG